MKTFILALLLGVTSAQADIVCEYDNPSEVSRVKDTGEAAYGDSEPTKLDCGGPDICSADVICRDGKKSVRIKAFCGSVDGGKCPANARVCVDGNYMKVDWKANMVAAPTPPPAPPATDAGGAGAR